METEKQSEIQSLATWLENVSGGISAQKAASELRRLHAKVQELEAMLDAVGAGGVSAQRVTQAADHIAQNSKMVATPAELNLDDYYCKGCGRIGEIEELSAQDKAKLRKLDGKPKTAAAPMVLPEPVAAQVRKGMLAINEEQLKKAKSHNTYIVGVIADKIEDGTLFDSGIYRRREIAEIVRNLLSTVTEFQAAAQEPFGYFKAEPFGWRDCAETDEGAVALYDAPQPQADALDTERLNWLIEQGCSNGVVYENVFGAFWMVWLDGDDVSKDKHQADRYPTARDAIDAAIAAAKESR